MLCRELSDGERIFLYKCVLRLHKEIGTAKKFFKISFYRKKNFTKNMPGELVHRYLIACVWSIVGGTDDICGIKSSLKLLSIIDLLYDSKYPVFNSVCKDIASTEFSYIDSRIRIINKLDDELLKGLSEAYNKYIFLLPNIIFNGIIDKCNV